MIRNSAAQQEGTLCGVISVPLTGEDGVKLSTAYQLDLWGVGTLAYSLCTGEHILLEQVRVNLWGALHEGIPRLVLVVANSTTPSCVPVNCVFIEQDCVTSFPALLYR